jgi:hypothetical protein
MSAEHVITPDDRCPCNLVNDGSGSGYCSYECFSKFDGYAVRAEPAELAAIRERVERDFVTDPGSVSGELAAELMQARLDRRALLSNFDAEHAKPAPEMPHPPAVEALGAVEPSNADTGRGTGVREAHERSEAVELVPGVWISSASPADHDRAAAASLRRIAEHRLNTAPDAIAYARAEGIAEAARLLDRVADDEGES